MLSTKAVLTDEQRAVIESLGKPAEPAAAPEPAADVDRETGEMLDQQQDMSRHADFLAGLGDD